MKWLRWVVAALAMALLFGGNFTTFHDVDADDPVVWATSRAEKEPAFCGTAWEVVMDEGGRTIGGDLPRNYAALDRQCVHNAGVLIAWGSALWTAGLAFTIWAIWLFLPRRRHAESTVATGRARSDDVETPR